MTEIPDEIMAKAREVIAKFPTPPDNRNECVKIIAAALSERTASEAALKEARDRIAELERPDSYWSVDDPESGWDCYREPVREADMGAVVALFTGKSLGTVWATTRVLTVDDHGDWDDTEIVCFDNEYEARRCWGDSLSAARSLAKTGGA